MFDRKHETAFCENVLPTAAGSTFLQNRLKNHEKMKKSHRKHQMASMMHTCAGLVGLKSENVDFPLVLEDFLRVRMGGRTKRPLWS